MPACVQEATVPPAPKSTSSGWAVTTRTRVTSVRTSTDRTGSGTPTTLCSAPAAQLGARAVERPLGHEAAAGAEHRAEHVHRHRAAQGEQQAQRRDAGRDGGRLAVLLDEV